MSYEELIRKIETWGDRKGINDPQAQLTKIMEELGETSAAFNKLQPDELIDAIGDLQVTIIIFAHLAGVDYKWALSQAYGVIAERKGKMHNGVFVKEEDQHE